MNRFIVLAVLAIAAIDAGLTPAVEAQAPTYQRRRAAAGYSAAPGSGSRAYAQPYGRPAYDHRQRQQGPVIGAGTFQRPYPYHLDYYKQKFGGGYDPYFGNLYGPPNVVLAPGFGYGYGFPGAIGPGYGNNFPGPAGAGPAVNAPGPIAVCPHCGQPWPTAAPTPGAQPVTPPLTP